MEQKISNIIIILAVLVAVLFFFYLLRKIEEPERVSYGKFTQCIKDKGAVFYGVFWCPNCAQQKQLFSSAAESLPYVECSSTKDQKDQTEICKKEGILSYPTWKFEKGNLAESIVCPTFLNLDLIGYITGCSVDDLSSDTATGKTIYDNYAIISAQRKLQEQSNISGETEVPDLETVLQVIRIGFDSELTKRFGTTVDNATTDQVLSILVEQTCVTKEVYKAVIDLTKKNQESQ